MSVERHRLSRTRYSTLKPRLVSRFESIVFCFMLCLSAIAQGAVVAVTPLSDSIIDARGMTLGANVAGFGTAINGESFETSAITAYGGYQYSAYWVDDMSSGTPSYHVAVARRQDSGTTPGPWQVCDLPERTESSPTDNPAGARPRRPTTSSRWASIQTTARSSCPTTCTTTG